MATLNAPTTPTGGSTNRPDNGPDKSTYSPEQQLGEILAQVTALREQVSQLAERESELRAVLERETELEPQLVRLGKILRKAVLVEQPAAAVANATLHLEPYPYTVIDDLLPDMFYDALLMGIPPVELFEHKPIGKQHLDVPFSMAPLYSRRVWRYHVRRNWCRTSSHRPSSTSSAPHQRLDLEELAESRP